MTSPLPAESTDPDAPNRGEWAVIVPVKPPSVGKSRLSAAPVDRADLARAIALDTIAAAAATPLVQRVIVVTSDAEVAREAGTIARVGVVPDPAEEGLDAAIAAGAEAAGTEVPRAALLGDLPALRPADLEAALTAAGEVERGLVADAEGTGSTLVTARAGAVWTSAFGENSAERHRLLGCSELDVPESSPLRRDVDTPEQLEEAASHGLGPRTAALLP